MHRYRRRLQINTGSNALAYNSLVQLTGGGAELTNSAFMSAWDPTGSATAGTLAAYSGTMYMVYTTPTWNTAPSYYTLGLLFQYSGDSYYQTFFPNSTTSAGVIDGYLTTIATYNYTVEASPAGGGFGFSLMINSSGSEATSPIFVDDISMTMPVYTPPPANSAVWATNGNGNWSSNATDDVNWVGSMPPSGNPNSTATFGTNGGTITASPTVNVIGTQEIGSMTFSTPQGYTLSGSGEIIDSNGITVTAGNNTVNVNGGVSLSSATETISVATGSSLSIPVVSDTTYGFLLQTGGGTLTIGTIGDLNLNATGTLNLADGSEPAANNSYFFDIQPQANATINLGANNYINNNTMENTGTINIGAGTTLVSGQDGDFTFAGAFSGSGTLILGSDAGSAGGPYTIGLTGDSSSFSGPITVAWTNQLQVGTGAVLGNASSTNTLTLDSGSLQAIGNVTLPQNVTIEDTQGIAGGVTQIDTQTYTLGLSGHISGPNTLQKIGAGTLILGTSNTYMGPTDVTAGTLVVGASGALPTNNALSITGGSLVQLATNTGGATLASLSIGSGSSLDIGNNHVIISDSGGGIDSTIRNYLVNGYNGGSWNGASGGSIMTSAPITIGAGTYSIGYADGADGVVAGLPSGELEVAYTLAGDANLDGKVDSADFGILADNYGASGAVWDEGDFNYDGKVDSADFGILAVNYGQSAGSNADVVTAADWSALDAFAAANAVTLSAVPEPATGGLLLLAGLGALCRRSRRLRQQ